MDEQQGDVTGDHTAHHRWQQGNVGFTSVSLGKLFTTQLAQGTGRALAHSVAKEHFSDRIL